MIYDAVTDESSNSSSSSSSSNNREQQYQQEQQRQQELDQQQQRVQRQQREKKRQAQQCRTVNGEIELLLHDHTNVELISPLKQRALSSFSETPVYDSDSALEALSELCQIRVCYRCGLKAEQQKQFQRLNQLHSALAQLQSKE